VVEGKQKHGEKRQVLVVLAQLRIRLGGSLWSFNVFRPNNCTFTTAISSAAAWVDLLFGPFLGTAVARGVHQMRKVGYCCNQ